MSDLNPILELFRSYASKEAQTVEELPTSGSNRRYFRIIGPEGSVIAVEGTCVEENKAFIALSRHFRSKGLNVPEVYAVSGDSLRYLQQDLGDEILFNHLAPGRERGSLSKEEKDILMKTISALPAIQFKGAEGFDFSVCYPQQEFDARMISFDQNYFKYCFLKATGLEFSEIKLDEDFRKMSEVLLRNASDTFMYRDFQSRNVMIRDGEPWFIDFQGGRKGPVYYDVASFIWQAKADYSESLKAELIDAYLEALKEFQSISREEFLATLRHFVLFRTLQVLGAYGFRGYFEKKPHFLQSVPYAMANLKRLLAEPFAEYPYLTEILGSLTRMPELTEIKQDKLEVEIYSFAFKKGIPNDASGNGGGYVFDCRALENPGKFEHYRHFNGLDGEVIKFMEDEGGVFRFLDNVYSLADAHVQRYIERKFTHLMFSFGCTGGQHRSVYCAQHLAEHIARKFNVKVLLHHRELGLEQDF